MLVFRKILRTFLMNGPQLNNDNNNNNNSSNNMIKRLREMTGLWQFWLFFRKFWLILQQKSILGTT